MTRHVALAAALMAALLVAAAPAVTFAQAAGTTLQVSGPVEARIGDAVELSALLLDAGGQPVPGVQLLAEERLGFFDTKATDVTVASAATGADGVAVIRYVARREGARTLTVRFPGNASFGAASAGLDFVVSGGPATYTVEAPPGIPGVNRFVVITVLLAVWGTMFVVASHVAAITRVGAVADESEASV